MKQVNLKAYNRAKLGGLSAKRYRKEGKIPAVIYGESGEKHLLIDQKELSVVLKSVMGKAALIDISFDDGSESRYAVVKEVERHPVSDSLMHVDFFEIVRGKPMTAMIPLHMHGEAFGAKNEGGVVEMHLHEVKVKCRPRDLPEMILVDVTNLKVGESIRVKDIKAPEGVKIEEDLEDLVISCQLPKEEPVEEAAPAEGEAAASEAPAAAEGAEAKKES